MATSGGALRAALNALIVRGDGVSIPLPDGTTWADVLAQYGSGAAVADRLGYRHGPTGSPEWKARRNFMRNFQGGRQGRHITPELRQRLRRGVTPGPRNRRQVLNLIDAQGVTVFGFTGELTVSQDTRTRPVPDRYVATELLHEHGFFPPAYGNQWPEAARAFFNAWGEAYGIGRGVIVDEIEDLELKIGE